jgi:hypothetical protein
MDHVQAIGTDFERGRDGPCPRWLHQMRPNLGRLAAVAEILQVGPFLGRRTVMFGDAAWWIVEKMQGA